MGSPHNSNTPTRRVPPPCWTQQETLALIHAYRDKWFSVNRGNLRSPDWDAVAASVAESSLPDLPPKSSTQCRHKVEKLRKRYRMEKKRCLDYPGRFFSSWDLFPLLDSIFVGSSAAASSKRCRIQGVDGNNDTGDDGLRVKMSRDRYLVRKCSNVDGGFDPDVDLGLDQDLAFMARKYSNGDYDGDVAGGGDLGSGFCMKNSVGDMNSVSVAFRPKDYGRVINGKLNSDIDFHCDYLKMENPQGPRLKACGKFSSDDSCPNYRTAGENIDAYSGFPLKTLGDVSTGFNPKFYRKTDDVRNSNSKFGYDAHCRSDERHRFGENAIVNGLVSPLPPPGFRQKSYSKIDGSSKLDVNSNVLNGIGNIKKSGIDDSSIKKVMDPIAELVSAVRLYTKSFVKVEKMKMEMAMELEKMRMETMLKHNKMILESQQQILEAFAQTALEKKKKRKEMEVLSPYPDKNEKTQIAATDCESIGKSGIAKEECEGGFT